MNSTASVAALEENIYAAIVVEFWKGGSYGTFAWQDVLNIGGTVLSDTLGLFLSGCYGIVCHELTEKSKQAS